MPEPTTEVYLIKGHEGVPTPEEIASAPPEMRTLLAMTRFALGDVQLTITNHTHPPQEH